MSGETTGAKREQVGAVYGEVTHTKCLYSDVKIFPHVPQDSYDGKGGDAAVTTSGRFVRSPVKENCAIVP